MSKNQTFFESAITAKYFGFIPTSAGSVSKDHITNTESHRKEKDYLDDDLFPMEEAVAILHNFKEKSDKDLKESKAIYFEGNYSGGHKKHRGGKGEEIINLHFLNSDKSITDSTIIKTAEAILTENGYKNICVKLNNIGGKEAQIAYTKEATAYYRKNINELNAHCRQLFKQSVHELITKGSSQCTSLHEEAPKPMEFLGEDSRKHFSDILESLEILNIKYEIDQSVLGDPDLSSHTVFKIIDCDTDKVIAAGTRYDLLARKIALRKDIPAMGVTMKINKPKKATKIALKKLDDGKLFFMQIAQAAKLKALYIVDELRKAEIPVKHLIHRDRLTSQLSASKKHKADYLIILGQKEAMDGSIIVRDKENKHQSIVKQDALVKHLKSLK